ncbi:DUF998 domain-containing protein [Parvularcula maris]|uniref:DUF998 domain-containing protein n=1 Tax=Parvularcula maris TaxID=2965077 RepID=A0A9X2L8A1_9PROT|nr:DUF998 domain-containing protein [Parvularcula maris]MCQ8184796.1 DUF998 domain-containing protein [Parvularcula maris]
MAQQHAARAETGGDMDDALRERFEWLPYRLLGGAALLGCAAALIADVVMWFLVEGYSPAAQTISELGAGPHQAVQDGGITAFSIGTALLGLGLTLRGRGGRTAMSVRAAVFLLAVVIAAIALYNEYGDGDTDGLEIHRYLLGALYLLVPFILFFGHRAAPIRHKSTKQVCRYAAIGWLVLAPLFFVVPEGWNGAYERALALVLVGAVGISAWRLFRSPAEETD